MKRILILLQLLKLSQEKCGGTLFHRILTVNRPLNKHIIRLYIWKRRDKCRIEGEKALTGLIIKGICTQ